MFEVFDTGRFHAADKPHNDVPHTFYAQIIPLVSWDFMAFFLNASSALKKMRLIAAIRELKDAWFYLPGSMMVMFVGLLQGHLVKDRYTEETQPSQADRV